MMIVALTAQGASFFHVRAAYPRSAETVKSSKSSHSQKRCRPPLAIAGRPAVPRRGDLSPKKYSCVQPALGYSSSRFQ